MIGALKHMLRLQEQHTAPDGGGGLHTVWQDVTLHPVIYAAIETRGGGEAVRLQRREPQITHHLHIRFRGDIMAGMRLVDTVRGHAYEILSVRDTAGDEKWLEITARQGTV